MSNPFAEHAQNFADYQGMLRGEDGSGGAMMTIQGAAIPCTHSEMVGDFNLVPGGQSPTTFIERLVFLDSDLPANFTPKKGILFSLKMNPSAPAIPMRLWHGGLQQGGLIWRFMAVDANYKA